MHTSDKLKRPKPALTGEISLEQLLAHRRSIREYPDIALSLAEVGQLLWAAQGITHAEGLRTAPSAGTKTSDEDVREALARAALSQSCVNDAPAVFVFTADYARTTKKYGVRG